MLADQPHAVLPDGNDVVIVPVPTRQVVDSTRSVVVNRNHANSSSAVGVSPTVSRTEIVHLFQHVGFVEPTLVKTAEPVLQQEKMLAAPDGTPTLTDDDDFPVSKRRQLVLSNGYDQSEALVLCDPNTRTSPSNHGMQHNTITAPDVTVEDIDDDTQFRSAPPKAFDSAASVPLKTVPPTASDAIVLASAQAYSDVQVHNTGSAKSNTVGVDMPRARSFQQFKSLVERIRQVKYWSFFFGVYCFATDTVY